MSHKIAIRIVGLMLTAMLIIPVTSRATGTSCSPQDALADLALAHHSYKEYNAYTEENNSDMADAALADFKHELVLAKNDGAIYCSNPLIKSRFWLSTAEMLVAEDGTITVNAALTYAWNHKASDNPGTGNESSNAIRKAQQANLKAILDALKLSERYGARRYFSSELQETLEAANKLKSQIH